MRFHWRSAWTIEKPFVCPTPPRALSRLDEAEQVPMEARQHPAALALFCERPDQRSGSSTAPGQVGEYTRDETGRHERRFERCGDQPASVGEVVEEPVLVGHVFERAAGRVAAQHDSPIRPVGYPVSVRALGDEPDSPRFEAQATQHAARAGAGIG